MSKMIRPPNALAADLSFVPKHLPPTQFDIDKLKLFLQRSRRLLVLTGAGISTESGIPDYRSDKVGLYARTNHKPILYSQFVNSATARQRYWARNYIGWNRFSQCKPNFTHHWLQQLQILNIIVTQNVDNLHAKAGSTKVVELHGTAFKVLCLNCDKQWSRHMLQNLMRDLNPGINETTVMIRPDGDVDIPEDIIVNFSVPTCDTCGGVLKPDIVFFGDNLPQSRVAQVQNYVTESDALLVLGSSLFVYSGYRIVLQAVSEGKRVAIVNIGPTRADKHADVKIAAKCSDVLKNININF